MRASVPSSRGLTRGLRASTFMRASFSLENQWTSAIRLERGTKRGLILSACSARSRRP